ncbi:right-handed parallel beta-helix repeat-containing protein [Burkholderia contaminans]|uniref:right-handed parallel beta-helix repeat-containing protein n=1 Tax=Burkholderia contaminans TaxID=488447 RepID=UPI00158A97B6|nr:right-handed parallel beta-helix repeat-containing protein [Burkholderia contaminans]
MTVTTQTQDVTYDGDGSTTDFPVPFYFLLETHIVVDKIDANGALTPLTYGTDYTVSGAGSESGGTVTTTAAYPAGVELHIYRDVPVTQETEYQQNDPFPAKTVEKALDKLTMICQQLASGVLNAIRYPLSEFGRDGTLPSALDRAKKLISFDDNGNLSMVPLPTSVGAGDLKNETWTAGTDYTAGVSTSVTLSRTYTSKANLGVVVMAGVPQDPASYTLGGGGTTLQFDAAIPAYVGRIWCYGGTTISLNTPATESVTDDKVAPGSALYDRIANNFSLMDPQFTATDFTARVQRALDFVGARGGGVVHVGDGVAGELVRSVYFNFPNTYLQGSNRNTNTLKAAASATGIDDQAMFKILADNCGLIEIGIDGNIVNNSSDVFAGVYAHQQTGTTIERCYIRGVIGAGIVLFSATGTSPNKSARILRNRIENCGAEGIVALYAVDTRIEGNDVSSTGRDCIRTDGVFGNIDLGVSANVNIVNNNCSKATPPTAIRGGGAEAGFMIVYGAGDQYIFVQDNFCFDNRNAGEDGIGLGQDGVHNNQGCIVQGNVVVYAGLFGIDATNQSVVQNNIILFSTQCGIKVGTDLGGNCTSCRIDGNLIINPNNPTTKYPVVQDMGIQVWSGHPPGVYAGIKIRNNTVVDTRSGAAQLTKYGLSIVFESGITMTKNEFSDNDFSQVGGLGIYAGGTGPSNTSGWRWRNNALPSDVPLVAGATPGVFGFENVRLVQGGAVTVTNLLGGYDGMTLDVQLTDGNTTWKFSGNPNMYGNGNVDLNTAAGNWMRFKFYNGVWAGQRTVQ